jgi:hypothetical protein
MRRTVSISVHDFFICPVAGDEATIFFKAIKHNKLNLLKKTIEESDKIFVEDAISVKALYRTATAHASQTGRPSQSITHSFQKLLGTDSENVEAKYLLVSVKNTVKNDNEKPKDLFSKIFKAFDLDKTHPFEPKDVTRTIDGTPCASLYNTRRTLYSVNDANS